MSIDNNALIFCELLPETKKRILDFAEALKKSAPHIGGHGLSEPEFWESEIFGSAIERLRGQQSATTTKKQSFMRDVLDHLKKSNEISEWKFSGSGERHDYEVIFPDGRISIIEAKGCLDGNNTNIFERPPQADEFIIWSLCQNAGADPRHNAWSGIHTRLSAEVIHRKQCVDGLVIWDMVCGTAGRPCPKLVETPQRKSIIGNNRLVPPPCIYLFPRTIPDPRSNPSPSCWKLEEVKLLNSLWHVFHGNEDDIVEVRVDTRMDKAELQRMTKFYRAGKEFTTSRWTTIKRARS